MKCKEFVEEFSGAPLMLYEVAESAVDVEDCKELRDAATQYLAFKQAFEDALENVGYELG